LYYVSPDNNDRLAVNQFTVDREQGNRRPDVVVICQRLPLPSSN
jgi:type I site-specific restriction-modification system R (restriction) subunit